MKHWVWLIDILILFLWKLSKNSLVKRLVWNYTKLHLLHFLLYRQISHYLVLYLCWFSCKVRSTDHTALYVMMPNDITSGILTPSDQTKTARKSENTSSTCCFLKVSVELMISRSTNWYYLIPLEGNNENTLLTCKNYTGLLLFRFGLFELPWLVDTSYLKIFPNSLLQKAQCLFTCCRSPGCWQF